MDVNMIEYGRVAALRIRAGKRNWSDAEALAEAFEALTREYPVGRGETERLAAVIASTPDHAPGILPSPGEIARRVLAYGYTDRVVMCQLPADCPMGPDPHAFAPPVDDVMPGCCRQPWEARNRSGGPGQDSSFGDLTARGGAAGQADPGLSIGPAVRATGRVVR